MANDRMTAKSIFLNALEQVDASARETYLAAACGENQVLRQQVKDLLANHRDGDLARDIQIACGLDADLSDDAAPNLIDQQIGPYKIREQIGEGGMGVVYAAEQMEPVRRKVAIKIIKPGMDSKEVLARFDSERQALAVMEHPNIARILDTGVTDTERPYFAMELVRGIPITEYCDAAELSPRDRIQLFQHVCLAVHHAHQKGIIHRDIKPSNVLVSLIDGQPVVKVIDFGLAKATGAHSLTDKTVYTRFLKMMGTPAYMSPEQAGLSGVDIDTRSDIYSLGVLLYELLTGDTPIGKEEIDNGTYEEVRKRIREVDAPKPSYRISTLQNAKLTTIAQQRRIPAERLVRELRGDLDWIVLKALEKDRERRYSSAVSLSEDIDRFLQGEPVTAAAPSPWYTMRKFISRHRGALATACAFALLLISATGISSTLAIQANESASSAEAAAQKARQAEGETSKALILARANEEAAITAKNAATELRKSIEKERDRLVLLNYANTIMRARHELDSGYPFEAQRLLEQVADYPDRGFEWYHLQHRLHPESVEIATEGSGASPQKVAYSPDGNRVAFCEMGKQRVRLFDVSSQTPEEQESLHCDRTPLRIAFSHDGDHIAVMLIVDRVGEVDGFDVSVYDAHSLQRLYSIPHRYRSDVNAPGYGFDFSPSANLLATVDAKTDSEDFRVRIWDVESGQVTQEIPIHYDRELMPRLQFSPDGKRIAVSDGRNWAFSVVIDLATEEPVATFDIRGSFSADGEHFVTHTDDISSIIDLNKPDQVKDFVKWKGRMYDFELSADGKWVGGSTDVGTHLWRADTLELVAVLPVIHADITFSPSGNSLVTLGDSFKIWDISNRPFAKAIVSEQFGHGGYLDLAWAPDNIRLVYGGRPGDVELWNTKTGETEVFRDEKGQQYRSTSVDWSGDGSMIAIAIEDAEYNPQGLGIFDVRTKRRMKLLVDPMNTCGDVRFSPDSKWLAARFDDGVVRLWSTSTWNAKTIVDAAPLDLTIYGSACSDYSFSPDSRELAVCRLQPRVDFFDVETGKLLRSHSLEPSDYRSHSKAHAEKAVKYVGHVDHSPDGSSVVVFVGLNRVEVLDCQTGDVTCRIDHVQDDYVSFTPTGLLMFLGNAGSGTHDRTRLFDATHGTELMRFENTTQSYFSPDGSQLFSVTPLSRTRPSPMAPQRDDWRMRGGIIYRAMPDSEYQRRVAIRNSSPPNDGPPD